MVRVRLEGREKMAKLSAKRAQAIYSAVSDRIMQLRVGLRMMYKISDEIDFEIAQAMNQAATAAVKAARGEK